MKQEIKKQKRWGVVQRIRMGMLPDKLIYGWIYDN